MSGTDDTDRTSRASGTGGTSSTGGTSGTDDLAGVPGIFRAVSGAADFARAVAAFGSGAEDAVPVWIGDRSDLLAALDLAAGLYPARRRPPVCAAGVVVGDVPATIRAFARPLARHWTEHGAPAAHGAGRTTGAPPADDGPLVVLGRYEDLRMDVIGPVLVDAYARGRDVFLLTGRDLHSLTWAIAKQYGEVHPDGATGLFTDLDTRPVATSATYHDARTVSGADLVRLTAERVWRRVLVSGHGTEDSINLGAHTVCGLSPAAGPGRSGPTCSYGRGCYKPEDKLIPAHRVRAAELVLSGCDSGALADLATYDPRYQLLLNAVDGPAQAVVAALSMHQSARVENLVWLDSADGDGSTARRLNASLYALHPYPTFIQVGLPSSAYPGASSPQEPAGAPAVESAVEPDGGPTGKAAAGSAVESATEQAGWVGGLSARAQGFLMTGMLPAAHPLREPLGQLAERAELTAVRPVMGPAADREAFVGTLREEARVLDRAIAVRMSERPDDPLSEFPRFFGDRSSVARTEAVTTPCVLCGREAWQYPRRGFTSRVPLTTAHVCLSCGPVGYWTDGAARLLGAASAATVPAGGTLRIEVPVVPSRPGPVQVGVLLPWSVRAAVSPPVQAVGPGAAGSDPRAGRPSAVFEVHLDASAPPQEHHFTVFAVQDLALSLLRCPFAVLPAGEV
ncbi:hypothetical protein [Streptomyces sp. BE303]|uniref:hypothetical protein n=1 Tax=Streptomyces sp. BE303 TaxID=3002528 RepID=UPI002E79635D|nr:hypothetical protein [Streptomyces sp. BE303]MED7952461.1 hypothetical protein [Streptomyces sp. BE303]